MQIAVLGDAHLISPSDPATEIHVRRAHFAQAWPSFRKMVALVRATSPDLVVSIGDLVDWYSRENADFAMELMSELGAPWIMTPGNHDLSTYERDDRTAALEQSTSGESRAVAAKGWADRGVELGNRCIADGAGCLVLLASPFGEIAREATSWITSMLDRHRSSIVFTHTPVDTPSVRSYITSVNPAKDLGTYVMQTPRGFYSECLRGRTSRIYCGHVHFAGVIDADGTTVNLLGLSTMSTGTAYPDMGQAVVFDTDSPDDRTVVRL
jgi:hypothetical protein